MGVAGVIALQVAAGVTQAYSSIQQGKAIDRQARHNARVQLQAAYDERRRAEQAVTDRRRKKSLLAGASRAAVGASGISVQSATVGGVMEDSAVMAELDVLRIKSNAERSAWGLEQNAVNTRYGGRAAKSNSYLKAGGTLLGTAAKATNTWRESR